MNRDQCERCGSSKVIPDAIFTDQGEYSDGRAKMAVSRNPSAIFFKGTERIEVKGALCCDCGHLSLRCEGDLAAMWDAWSESQRHRG